jgi:hypothetical protein
MFSIPVRARPAQICPPTANSGLTIGLGRVDHRTHQQQRPLFEFLLLARVLRFPQPERSLARQGVGVGRRLLLVPVLLERLHGERAEQGEGATADSALRRPAAATEQRAGERGKTTTASGLPLFTEPLAWPNICWAISANPPRPPEPPPPPRPCSSWPIGLS